MKIIYYINQFFGNIGGEEAANQPPVIKEGAVGPAGGLESMLDGKGEVVATVICGDSYFAENQSEATDKILNEISKYEADIFVAGPAFNAGRYGIACGAICQAVQEKLQIPALTAMYPENPGVDPYSKEVYILKTGDSAASMRKALPKMAEFIPRLLSDEEIGFPEEEGYIPQGRRVNIFSDKPGAVRAVDMLMKKMKGEEFETELPMPVFTHVEPVPGIILDEATIAVITTGGIVPWGNPDSLKASNADRFLSYNIEDIDDLKEGEYQTVHGGYDPVYANEDPDRILPLDVLKELESEKAFKKLYNEYFVTVGNTTAVSNARKFGEDIAERLLNDGVDGVILTSTWGTDTRCGATMVKYIEKAGIPAVHICAITNISETVGANRIVPAVAIPHPTGNPEFSKDEEYLLRKNLIKKALEALETDINEQTLFKGVKV